MPLSDIVNPVVTSNSRGVSRRSFGVGLVAGYHTNWYDTFREYSLATITADLVSDGFTTYDPVYRAATAYARNTPKGKKVIVGRLQTAYTQQFKITIETAAAEEGRTLSFDVISPDGTETAISYTVQPADTTTLVGTAIAALMDAITDMSAASVAGVITVDADNSGEMFYLSDFASNVKEGFISLEDTTADSNLAAEIALIDKAYPDTYGLTLSDPRSKTRCTAAAAAYETQEKIFFYTTHDTDVGDPASTTDVFYSLKAADYYRTGGVYSGDQTGYAAAVWMGNRFPTDPGSSTWVYKSLSGVTVDDLPATFTSAIEGKNGNYYTSLAGLNLTRGGKTASGEWVDSVRGRDWLVVRMQERLVGLLANAPKVPYTQKGAEAVGSEVAAQCAEGVGAGYLAEDPEPVVTVPDVTDSTQVSDANKIERTLPGVAFEVVIAGAIHIIDPLNGVVKVS